MVIFSEKATKTVAFSFLLCYNIVLLLRKILNMKTVFDYSEEFNGSLSVTGFENDLQSPLFLDGYVFEDSDVPNEIRGLRIPKEKAIKLAESILKHYKKM